MTRRTLILTGQWQNGEEGSAHLQFNDVGPFANFASLVVIPGGLQPFEAAFRLDLKSGADPVSAVTVGAPLYFQIDVDGAVNLWSPWPLQGPWDWINAGYVEAAISLVQINNDGTWAQGPPLLTGTG